MFAVCFGFRVTIPNLKKESAESPSDTMRSGQLLLGEPSFHENNLIRNSRQFNRLDETFLCNYKDKNVHAIHLWKYNTLLYCAQFPVANRIISWLPFLFALQYDGMQ